MAAHAKLTGQRERRLLTLVAGGEPLAAACRAVLVSREAVHRRARRDEAFALRLRRARADADSTVAVGSWQEAAAVIAANNAYWATLPSLSTETPTLLEIDDLDA